MRCSSQTSRRKAHVSEHFQPCTILSTPTFSTVAAEDQALARCVLQVAPDLLRLLEDPLGMREQMMRALRDRVADLWPRPCRQPKKLSNLLLSLPDVSLFHLALDLWQPVPTHRHSHSLELTLGP